METSYLLKKQLKSFLQQWAHEISRINLVFFNQIPLTRLISMKVRKSSELEIRLALYVVIQNHSINHRCIGF